MKKVVLFVLTVLVCGSALAQDIIFLTNGDEIEAVVVKVTETELEYKRYDNPDGPSYVKLLDKIFMVKYENGVKDVFTTPESVMRQQTVTKTDVPVMGEHSPLTLSRNGSYIVSNVGALKSGDLKRLLGDDGFNDYLSARKGYDVGNTLAAFGMALGVASSFCFLGGMVSANDGSGNIAGTLIVVGSLGFVVHSIMTPIGFVCRGIATGQISRIAEGYNAYNKSVAMEMGLSPTLFAMEGGIAPGVGVSVRF